MLLLTNKEASCDVKMELVGFVEVIFCSGTLTICEEDDEGSRENKAGDDRGGVAEEEEDEDEEEEDDNDSDVEKEQVLFVKGTIVLSL